MKRLPSLFSSVYSRVKLFVFSMNSRRRYSIFESFIYGVEEMNSKSEVIFAVCRLPFTSCLTSLMIRCKRDLVKLNNILNAPDNSCHVMYDPVSLFDSVTELKKK